jgi:ATP-dependent Lon protease
MTGEITLRGRVLPIGGLKEKLLAALRGGIKTVMIPEDNAKDLPEIPDNVKNGLEIIPVAKMSDVLRMRLVRMPEAITWDPDAKAETPRSQRKRAKKAARPSRTDPFRRKAEIERAGGCLPPVF